MASRQDGAPVLDRHTEHPRSAAVMHHQFVSKGRGEQVSRGHPFMGLGLPADDVVPIILGVVDKGAGLLIDPVVGHDTVP